MKKESADSRNDILIAVFISGSSSASILAIVNYSAENSTFGSFDIRNFSLFAIAILLYVNSLKFAVSRIANIFESIINNIRIRLGEKIRGTELLALEEIGKSTIYEKFTQETEIISELETPLAALMNSAVMLVFAMVYVAFLSVPAFFLMLGAMGIGVLVYNKGARASVTLIRQSQQEQVEFIDAVSDQLDGFNEVKVNTKRSASVMGEIRKVSDSMKRLKIAFSRINVNNFITSQCIFYFMMGAVAFILPMLIPTYQNVINELTAATLFIVGPLSTLVGIVPTINRANIAIEGIYELEERLDAAKKTSNLDTKIKPLDFNREIQFKEVMFTYKNQDGTNNNFAVGPLSFDVQKGELLMIIGGNGSGKSTIMKLLASLYFPDAGQIKIDDTVLDSTNVQHYRENLSLIFGDFHLFKKLYGLEGVAEKTVQDLLKTLGLENKTAFVDDQFTNIKLSTGQRKRLALLVTLLEDRSIYMFDEWTADQDPEFRKYFYEVLLTDLKARGKTVIAISHDDRYFHVADKLLKVDYGKIEFQKISPSTSPS